MDIMRHYLCILLIRKGIRSVAKIMAGACVRRSLQVVVDFGYNALSAPSRAAPPQVRARLRFEGGYAPSTGIEKSAVSSLSP
jgi:hypothetical protein